MPYTPHNAAVAAAFMEIDATINKKRQYDPSKSEVENWNEMVLRNKRIRKVLIQLVKQLDAENVALRSTFGMPPTGGGAVMVNDELIFDPDNEPDDFMVRQSIASLDPDH
jgi:hypothetical protein